MLLYRNHHHNQLGLTIIAFGCFLLTQAAIAKRELDDRMDKYQIKDDSNYYEYGKLFIALPSQHHLNLTVLEIQIAMTMDSIKISPEQSSPTKEADSFHLTAGDWRKARMNNPNTSMYKTVQNVFKKLVKNSRLKKNLNVFFKMKYLFLE